MGHVYACCVKRVAAAERHKKKGPDWVPFLFGAGNEIRTRDPDLGKVVLYQLSYSRLTTCQLTTSELVASPRGVEPLLPP